MGRPSRSLPSSTSLHLRKGTHASCTFDRRRGHDVTFTGSDVAVMDGLVVDDVFDNVVDDVFDNDVFEDVVVDAAEQHRRDTMAAIYELHGSRLEALASEMWGPNLAARVVEEVIAKVAESPEQLAREQSSLGGHLAMQVRLWSAIRRTD